MKKGKSNWLKLYAIGITVLCIFALAAFWLVFQKAGYDRKLLAKLGLAEPAAVTTHAAFGWNNTLYKMDYDADVVFFGDSITQDSDFRTYFPEQAIVNLGLYGDTLTGMIDRVPGVASVKPEKVFLLGGINGLTDRNVDICAETYEALLEELEAYLPDSQIFIQSVLPISSAREGYGLHNSSIVEFNSRLAAMAQERGMTYVDLYALYEKDGQMNPEFSADGLHLLPESYGLWAEQISAYME